MKDEEILRKAIEKAQKNGYLSKHKLYGIEPSVGYISTYILFFSFDDGENSIDSYSCEYKSLIFSHDFAKAFWYKENTKPQPAINFSTSIVRAQPARLVGWQNHLQIMVVEENPIKYIERYL